MNNLLILLAELFLADKTSADVGQPSWELGRPVTPAFARYKDAYEHSIKLMGFVADDVVRVETPSFVT